MDSSLLRKGSDNLHLPRRQSPTGASGRYQELQQNLGQVFWDVLSTISESASLGPKKKLSDMKPKCLPLTICGVSTWAPCQQVTGGFEIQPAGGPRDVTKFSAYLRKSPFACLLYKTLLLAKIYNWVLHIQRLPSLQVKLTLVSLHGPLLLRFALCAKACEDEGRTRAASSRQ